MDRSIGGLDFPGAQRATAGVGRTPAEADRRLSRQNSPGTHPSTQLQAALRYSAGARLAVCPRTWQRSIPSQLLSGCGFDKFPVPPGNAKRRNTCPEQLRESRPTGGWMQSWKAGSWRMRAIARFPMRSVTWESRTWISRFFRSSRVGPPACRLEQPASSPGKPVVVGRWMLEVVAESIKFAPSSGLRDGRDWG